MASTATHNSAFSIVAADTLIYLVLGLLVWLTWQVSGMGWFASGDDVGYWMGVAGGVMMLLLLMYPLRKNFRFAQNWGSMRVWFFLHMFFGIGGPTLILLHSTYRIGSLNGGVAFFSMLIVAASGIIGRFLYVRVHRNLRIERAQLDELRSKVRLDQNEVRSRLAFAPNVEILLRDFEARERAGSRAGVFALARKTVWLPLDRWIVYLRCMQEIKEPLRKLAKHGNWTSEEFRRRERKVKVLVHTYSHAVVRVAQQASYERLFSLWHVAHIPFVYLLVGSAIIHVLAVHMY